MASDDASQSAVTLLSESREAFSSVLSSFQQNHDLCLRQAMFSSSFTLKLDQCAYSFRSLALLSVDLSGVVTRRWIDQIILFYDNLPNNTHSYNTSQLELLGGQAKKLGRVFKVIAEWSRDLSGRVHSAGEQLKTESYTIASQGFLGQVGFVALITVIQISITSSITGAIAAILAMVSGQAAQSQVDRDLAELRKSFDSQSLDSRIQVLLHCLPIHCWLSKLYCCFFRS